MQPNYKKKEGVQARRTIIKSLESQIRISADKELIQVNDDALDAVICVLAGYDFLMGKVITPSQDALECAKKEGWIWVQCPSTERSLNGPFHTR